MAFFKLALLLVVAAVSAYEPGTTVTSTTTTTTVTTTTSSDDEGNGAIFGISSSDRNLIRSTWNLARRNGEVAPTLLLRFLQAHPEYQKKFHKFANVPQSQLLKNGDFLAQAFTILAGLNVVIQSSGSEELLAQEAANLGVTHFARHVTVSQFEEFAHVLVQVLEEKLGSISFNAAAKHAWENGLRALIAGISKNLHEAKNVPHPLTKLTPHQIEDVRRSWESVRGKRYEGVSAIFKGLFRDNPSLQKKFRAFDNVPIDDLDNSDAYTQQVHLVADRLDHLISTLDLALQASGQINYLAHSHVPRGVRKADFELFARRLYALLAKEGVSADDLESWKGALTVLVQSIDKVQNH